jgi:hypothetical protein
VIVSIMIRLTAALSVSTLLATALGTMVRTATRTAATSDPAEVIRRSVEMNEADRRAEPTITASATMTAIPLAHTM